MNMQISESAGGQIAGCQIAGGQTAGHQSLELSRVFFGDVLLVGLALIAGNQSPRMRVVTVTDRQPIRSRESFSAEYQEVPARPQQKRSTQKVKGEIFGDDVTFKMATGPSRLFKVPLPDARKAGAQAIRMHLPQLIALFYQGQAEGLRDSLYTLTAKRGFLALSPEIELQVGDDLFRIDRNRATVTRAGETMLDLSREELRQKATEAGYL